MSEFKRWTDEGAPDAIGRLLEAAESEQPSAASLTNTLTRLGLAGGVAAGVTTGAATSSAAGATALTSAAAGGKLSALALTVTFAKWIALGTALGGASLAVYTASSDGPAPSAVAPPAALASARQQPAAPSPAPPAAPAPSAIVLRSLATPATPRAASATSRGRSSSDAARDPAAEAIPAETLAAEIAGIDRARGLLAAGRPAAALAALDDYERRFPRHHFAPEVLYLRMEAASRAGRSEETRELARSLLARYPQSPQSEKAKQLLDQKSSDRR